MGLLDGKTGIVTGGAKGLGRAIAERWVNEGANVVIGDIDGAGAEATAAEIGATGVACDVTQEADVEALVAKAVSDHGSLDIACANAGIAGTVSPLTELSLEDWRKVTAINLDGVFLTIKHAGKAMAGSGGGSIVLISSVTSIRSLPLIGPYPAAKAGVVSLAQTAALELRGHGVRVNAVAPGFVGTDLVEGARPDLEAATGLSLQAEVERKQGRFGTPQDVANLVTFLASDRTAFCNGNRYVCDGGAVASVL